MPGDHRRPLHQVRHLVEQARPAPAAARCTRPPSRPAWTSRSRHDALAPLLAIEHDEVLEQPRLVVVEGLDLDGAAGPAAGGEEPVAVGRRARSHVLHQRRLRALGAADVVRARRGRRRGTAASASAGRTELALAVVEPRVPVHRLRERQAAQQPGHARRAARRPTARPRCRLRTARYRPFGVSISSSASTARRRSSSQTRWPPAWAGRRRRAPPRRADR